MAPRIEYWEIAPNAVRALAGLNAYSDSCSIDPKLRRLLEVRASQINGCSYCIQVHRKQATQLGESAERLDALEAWRAASLFSDRERAALAWVETVTLIAHKGAPGDVYEPLRAVFSDGEIVDLTFIIVAMNAWNRLAIALRHEASGKT